jgi:hypothetical protein
LVEREASVEWWDATVGPDVSATVGVAGWDDDVGALAVTVVGAAAGAVDAPLLGTGCDEVEPELVGPLSTGGDRRPRGST